MSKTLTPRQRERRARILQTARELIDESGYAGMTTRELASRAGVSATTLFNLYNTKEELLLAALREQLDGMGGELDESQGNPGWERILAFLQVIASQSDRTPAYALAIVHALLQAGRGDPLVRILVGNFRAVIEQSLDHMASKRQLRDGVAAEDLAQSLVAAFWGVEMLWEKGVIDDGSLSRTSSATTLSILAASTRGQTQKAIDTRLRDLT